MCPETVCKILRSPGQRASCLTPEETSGINVLFVEQADSTQSIAAKLAIEGAPAGTVVIARTQTSGRGRMGRRWLSPAGGLYASLILRPSLPVEKWAAITVHAGIAVVLHSRAGGVPRAALKWPNDCLVDGRKLCGLLAESFPGEGFVVLGIGMNVDWCDDLAQTGGLDGGYDAVALAQLTDVDQDQFCSSLIESVINAVDVADRGAPVDSDVARSILWTDGTVEVDCGDSCSIVAGLPAGMISGDVLGVDGNGRLMLRLPDGKIRALSCGEVLHARSR